MSPTARTNCLGFSLLFGTATLCCGGIGMTFLFQVPVYLAFGWVPYLARVVPKLNPDQATVATAVACLLGVVVGGHAFFRWLYANTSPEPRRWPWRWTFQLAGLVVVMFVAGIAVTGVVHQTTWLARAPGPIIADPVQTRLASANNLKEIGLAAHGHNDTLDALPRSTFDAHGRPMHSWQTAILPFIEQDPLFRQIDLSKPWTHPANATAMQTRLKVYLNPSVNEDSVNGYPASHYAGNVSVVMGDTPKKMTDFPHGSSNTVLAGEVNTRVRAWGDPLNARDPRLPTNAHPDGFGAPNRPPQFLMLDGSVRTFDPKELADVLEMMGK